MKLEYNSDVRGGVLQKNVRELIAKELPHFEGKRVVITIEKIKSTRSAQQNRLWWSWITIVSKELGYTKEEMHAIAGYKFLLREKLIESTGEIVKYIESTTKLNKSEFSDLCSEFQRWCAQELNIQLPEPGELFDIGFEDEEAPEPEDIAETPALPQTDYLAKVERGKELRKSVGF